MRGGPKRQSVSGRQVSWEPGAQGRSVQGRSAVVWGLPLLGGSAPRSPTPSPGSPRTSGTDFCFPLNDRAAIVPPGLGYFQPGMSLLLFPRVCCSRVGRNPRSLHIPSLLTLEASCIWVLGRWHKRRDSLYLGSHGASARGRSVQPALLDPLLHFSKSNE